MYFSFLYSLTVLFIIIHLGQDGVPYHKDSRKPENVDSYFLMDLNRVYFRVTMKFLPILGLINFHDRNWTFKFFFIFTIFMSRFILVLFLLSVCYFFTII